jgi:hypothetical protein
MDEFHGQLQDDIFAQIYYLVFFHLIPKICLVNQRLLDLVLIYADDFKIYIIILFIGSLIISIICQIFLFIFKFVFNTIYEVQFILLRRLSPSGIVATADLLVYLMNRTHFDSETVFILSQAIIQHSSDSIFCLSSQGRIELINSTVNENLKYNSESMFGLHFGINF